MSEIWSPLRCLTGATLPPSDMRVDEELKFLLEKQAKFDQGRKTKVYHPSAVGGPCRRVLYYQRIGAKEYRTHWARDEFMFAQGHAIHDIAQKAFNRVEEFVSEVTLSNEDLGLYGHCDGIFTKSQWVLEIKTIGDASYTTLLRPLKGHIAQAHCYMYCLDIPRIQFLYINRNTLETRCFRVQFDLEVWKPIEAKLRKTEAEVLAGIETPREGAKYECGRCAFALVCRPEEHRIGKREFTP